MRRRPAYSADCSAFLTGIEMHYGGLNVEFCPEDAVAPRKLSKARVTEKSRTSTNFSTITANCFGVCLID